jgi:hypothetical protein
LEAFENDISPTRLASVNFEEYGQGLCFRSKSAEILWTPVAEILWTPHFRPWTFGLKQWINGPNGLMGQWFLAKWSD